MFLGFSDVDEHLRGECVVILVSPCLVKVVLELIDVGQELRGEGGS